MHIMTVARVYSILVETRTMSFLLHIQIDTQKKILHPTQLVFHATSCSRASSDTISLSTSSDSNPDFPSCHGQHHPLIISTVEMAKRAATQWRDSWAREPWLCSPWVLIFDDNGTMPRLGQASIASVQLRPYLITDRITSTSSPSWDLGCSSGHLMKGTK